MTENRTAPGSGGAGAPDGFDLARYLAAERDRVERALEEAVSRAADRVRPALVGPIRHGVLSGGKRLRPILCVAGYSACGGSDADGAAAIRAGKYISEKVYTDVTIGGEGKSELNLNLDVRPGVKLRGTLESDGGTGIGIFYEKDY